MINASIRKIVNQDWLTLSLLLGFILVIALVTSIPIFTEAVLQRMLTKELEQIQVTNNSYPGNYSAMGNFEWIDPSERWQKFQNVNRNLNEIMIPGLDLPVLARRTELNLGHYFAEPANKKEETNYLSYINLKSIESMNDHITLLHGRLPEATNRENYFETMVSTTFLQENEFFLNDEIIILENRKDEKLRLKITGIFEYSDLQDLYWDKDLTEYDSSFFLSYPVVKPLLLDTASSFLEEVSWHFAVDYTSIHIKDLDWRLAELNWQEKSASQYQGKFDLGFPVHPILRQYKKKEKELRFSLWLVLTPVFLLLGFYTLMVSELVVNSEANEIAVLKSRGFTNGALIKKYLFETLLILGLALLAGPPLGFAFSRIIGSTDGFIEFINRPIPAMRLSVKAVLYSLVSTGIILFIRMIPVFQFSRLSIVELKRNRIRPENNPFWHRFYLDIVLLLVSAYGIYRFSQQLAAWRDSSAGVTDQGLDPLLFIASTLFLLGAGLLFLRCFPLLIKSLFLLNRENWSPSAYATLLHIERSRRENSVIMLFLIISIATGIFSANTARTMNRNIEDQLYYKYGSDLIIKPQWSASFPDDGSGTVSMEKAREQMFALMRGDEGLNYVEPDFSVYRDLENVSSAARVFRTEKGEADLFGRQVSGIEVLGIDTYDFGMTSWFRNDLSPYHFYSVLNVLNEQADAVLLSSSFKQYRDLSEGEEIMISWSGQQPVPVTIYGFVDFWPTLEPDRTLRNGNPAPFIIGNLDFFHSVFAKNPYEVWLKLDDKSDTRTVYQDIEKKEIGIREIINVRQLYTDMKNDPIVQGLNGVLTQGFIVIMLLTFIGFLLFRIIALFRRSLQFGIIRAVGLSRAEVMKMIITEQMITFGSSLICGVLLGTASSRIFIPFLQIFFSFSERNPPFLMVSTSSDYLKIYAVVLLLLILAYISIRSFIRHLNIGSAIKLGED